MLPSVFYWNVSRNDHLAHILLLRSTFLSEQHNPYFIIFAKKVTQGQKWHKAT